ncbi:MAG: hypothetical protein AAF191_02715 [Verrucomicrobiota bacterium]
MNRFLFFTFLGLTLLPAVSLGEILSPKPGDPLRKAVLDSVRKPVEQELNQEVLFKVHNLRVSDQWAFFTGLPLTKVGQKRIDYSRTKYAEAVEADMFEDWVCALLKRKGNKFVVVEYYIGATDNVYSPWPSQYGASMALVYGEE